MTDKKGQLKKISIAAILILLLTIVIINAQDVVQDSSALQETQVAEIQEGIDLQNGDNEAINEEIEATSSAIQELANLCENMKCDDSTLICNDGFIVLCENSCDLETGACGSCTPNCEEHEQIVKQNQTEDDISKLPENGTAEIINEASETNASASELSELNKTEIANQTENQNNETSENETAQSEQNGAVLPLTGEIIEGEIPQLDVQLIYPKKITRGEEIEVKAIITNFGGVAGDVLITWDLPFGFEIIYGDKITTCGNLDNTETCNFSIYVRSSVSTSSGINEIKIKGNYKNGI